MAKIPMAIFPITGWTVIPMTWSEIQREVMERREESELPRPFNDYCVIYNSNTLEELSASCFKSPCLFQSVEGITATSEVGP